MVEDARERTKTYIETYYTPGNVKKDDGSTEASVITCFGYPDYPLNRVFKDKRVDGIYVIHSPESSPLMDAVTQAPYGYVEQVPIDIRTVDKTGITGVKLQWKMEAELRRIVETYPTGSLRQFRVMGDSDERLGGLVIYGRKMVLTYQRDTT